MWFKQIRIIKILLQMDMDFKKLGLGFGSKKLLGLGFGSKKLGL